MKIVRNYPPVSIRFIAQYGWSIKLIELCQPTGAGGSFYITIDSCFYGKMVEIQGYWKCRLHHHGALYSDDQLVLEEIVNDHFIRLDTVQVCKKLMSIFKVQTWPA